MTACWVPEPPFWPFVKKGDHLDPDFGKIISGNIFNHKEDSLGIILSRIPGPTFWFMKAQKNLCFHVSCVLSTSRGSRDEMGEGIIKPHKISHQSHANFSCRNDSHKLIEVGIFTIFSFGFYLKLLRCLTY